MLREDFLSGMRQAASGVAIVTTQEGGERTGVTVSALCSLSADPPSLLVCINQASRTARAILASGCFCANLLADEQWALSDVFAGRTPAKGEERIGVTVSAICSLSLEPPSLLVCIHHLSRASAAILESGCFCANILGEEQDELSEIFAGRKSVPEDDRFAAVEWLTLATGSPALQGALAAFDCTLVQHMRWGSHHVFLGSVCDVELGQGRPLVYCDRSYARVAPATL